MWGLVVAVSLLCGTLQVTALERCPLLRAAANVPASDKTGCYVVVLKRESNDSTFESIQSQLLDLSSDFQLHVSVKNIAKAITVALDEDNLDIVSHLVSFFCKH